MHTNSSMHRYPGMRVILFLLAMLPISPAASAQATPNIVTSIRPIHSLVTGLTESVTTPVLLMDQLQSPHHYHLRPSDVRKLQQADIIIYAGPEIETFMQDLLKRMDGKHIIAWSEIPGMDLHQARKLEQGDDAHGHEAHQLDGHLWLSTYNAQRLVNHLRDRLITIDPDNRDRYRRNAARLSDRLQALRQSIDARMETIRDRPFIQFHDAFQYFEEEFDLTGGHFFTTGSEHRVGIRQLQQVRQFIEDRNVRCIFYEPPVVPPIIDNLVMHENTRVLPLDPVGRDVNNGADLYFSLMDNIARQLEVCLK